MSWRKPTTDDLTSCISAREIEAFKRSADFGGDDPVDRILVDTAELVRSYCRSNGNIKLSPTTGEIPESLISPAMDYATVQLLKRMPVQISEGRTSARNAALRIFGDVATGKLMPESYGAAVDADSGKVSIELAVSSRRRVTSAKLEGL